MKNKTPALLKRWCFFVVQAEHRTWWRCQSRRDKNEYQTAAIICLSAADRTGTHVTSIIHSLLYTPFSFICCWLVVEFSFSCVYLLNLSCMSFFLSDSIQYIFFIISTITFFSVNQYFLFLSLYIFLFSFSVLPLLLLFSFCLFILSFLILFFFFFHFYVTHFSCFSHCHFLLRIILFTLYLDF